MNSLLEGAGSSEQMQELFQSMLEVTELRELKDVACPWEEAVFIAQSCPTLCDPMDCSPPGSSVHGILQTRILQWIAIFFSRDLPNLGIKPRYSALEADSLLSEPPGKRGRQKQGRISGRHRFLYVEVIY